MPGLLHVRRHGGRIEIWCATCKDTGEKIGDGVLTPVPIDTDETDGGKPRE
ncbi:hypothetical protein [Roseovarius sp. A-2]|uniref:hypothetical protein n=1 Tax=Roseovarius sp. A-2 TaxID=1570360 RepID=UPI001593F833|nr:hypothetical protein [Roseovarius sp. A-2]